MSTITQAQWDSFKSQFPNDKKIQAVTFEELLKNTDGGKVDWGNLPMAKERGVEVGTAVEVSDCEWAIGCVIFDTICLAIGAVGLRSGLSRETAEAVADAAKPAIPEIEATVKEIAEGASKKDMAKGVFKILGTIYRGALLGAVLKAFLNSLTWYQMLLYAATAMATIVAILATDGIAFVARVVILLASFGWLVADSVDAVKVCG